MNITFKTDYGKSLLDLSNEELVAKINELLSTTVHDKNLLSDLKTIHRFILDHQLGVQRLREPKTPCGLHYLKYLPTVNMVYDFSKPLNEIITDDDFETYLSAKYIQMKLSSKKRGIDFTLTISQLRNLLKRKQCYYSGIRFDDKHTLTIDRLDNTKGYCKDNVVVCSSIINKIKESVMENKRVTDTMNQKQIEKMLLKFIKVNKEKEIAKS